MVHLSPLWVQLSKWTVLTRLSRCGIPKVFHCHFLRKWCQFPECKTLQWLLISLLISLITSFWASVEDTFTVSLQLFFCSDSHSIPFTICHFSSCSSSLSLELPCFSLPQHRGCCHRPAWGNLSWNDYIIITWSSMYIDSMAVLDQWGNILNFTPFFASIQRLYHNNLLIASLLLLAFFYSLVFFLLSAALCYSILDGYSERWLVNYYNQCIAN